MRSPLFMLLFVALLLGGCQSKQVRHLASDASLIKPGVSTLQDVQRYLGEPDNRREVAPGVSEYVYYEDRPGLFGTMPLVGSWVDSTGYEMIIVTLQGNLVTNCEFRNFSESERAWTKDYTWKEVK
ncbi:hypothetical protein JWJ90_14380 [Desulfobulbus rhabdoformis]|jgi:hypothetical protein|uniref:hypothetical protein n=1 Tax=Desulfobulbus rhabdoformis TaxID=34032 RepID=UPI001962AC57|nr:hypothetical protein [Desulfobulbus rhabdoformis]MBM9615467.1 hypothetical protein [Desulfobulbus rhabdoformis]